MASTPMGDLPTTSQFPARRIFRIPASLPFHLAALAEPVAVAVHGLRMGGVQRDKSILVRALALLGWW
jgi:threonine dehydrogenase-like Zn-dependent dehydrogenase